MEQPQFAGLRVTQDPRAAQFGAARVPLETHQSDVLLEGLSLDPLWIRGGGNSGYQAINLAVLLGAARVLLLGYDMQGTHWHGRHPAGLNNPDESAFARWRAAFATMLPDLPRAGVEVINCSRETALTCFPRARLEDVL